MPPRRHVRAVTAVAVAAAVVCGASACGGDAEPSGLPSYGGNGSSAPATSAPTTTPTSSAPTTPTYEDAVPTVTEGAHAAPESAEPVVAAVVGYQKALVTSLHEGATAGDLGAVAGGAALGDVVAAARDWKSKGWSLRGSMVVAVGKATVSGATATATGCLKDSTAAFEAGKPVQTPKTTYAAYTAQLTKRGSSWVVREFSAQSRGTCAV